MWDHILHRDGRREPVEEWGGISYALHALSIALPEDWVISPIVKIGEDMAEEALRFLRGIPRVEIGPGVEIVPFPNSRVELRYLDQTRRLESLRGGVPGWSWEELEPLVAGVDALYLNFITGFEMELATAGPLPDLFPGPLYGDLHSLFLSRSVEGLRAPRELPGWGAWLRAFDVVQMNEEEFELLGRSWGDPWLLAAGVVGPEVKLIAVTLGEKGAAYVAAPEFVPDPLTWPLSRKALGVGGASRSGRTPLEGKPVVGDPTGCGDVWGATFFGRLLFGDSLDAAMTMANRMARRNVEHRGTRDLHLHLRGRLSS
ncbi:carbohydrate kinase family protein [Gemmatimonadota bacterium]